MYTLVKMSYKDQHKRGRWLKKHEMLSFAEIRVVIVMGAVNAPHDDCCQYIFKKKSSASFLQALVFWYSYNKQHSPPLSTTNNNQPLPSIAQNALFRPNDWTCSPFFFLHVLLLPLPRLGIVRVEDRVLFM